jgi:outer membrane receptor protein involved in Fe transport
VTLTPRKHLDVTIAASYLDAIYTQFRLGNAVDYTGNRLPLAPKFSGRVGIALHDLPNLDGISFQADFVHRSQQFFSPDGGVLRQPAYGLLSARAAYQFPGSGPEIFLSGENLANVRYATTGQTIDAVNVAVLRLGEPRRIALGARLQW